jgi:integrase
MAGLTPHCLRHGFASIAADLGLTEITIAALIGHSAATVTGRYIHHVDSVLCPAADRLSAQIAAAMNGREIGADIVPLSFPPAPS